VFQLAGLDIRYAADKALGKARSFEEKTLSTSP
jgi:hypothetical protein